MKKILSILVALCVTISLSAEVATMYYDGGTTKNMAENVNNASLVNLSADTFYVAVHKNGNTTAPGLNKVGDIRLYAGNVNNPETVGEGNIMEINVIEGINIQLDSINITFTNNYSTGCDISIVDNVIYLKNVNTVNQQVRFTQALIYYTKKTATGLGNTQSSKDSKRYNLLGMPVNENYKGVVIIGHKKVLQ